MSLKDQLKNGMQVLLIPSRKSPVVSVQMWVKTGSADEKKGEEGLSHFIEHLVFKGTDKFQVGEIAGKVEGDGGELNAYTSFDQTVFYVTISKEFTRTALEAVSQMMGFPTFDAGEIDSEREVVLEEIKRSLDSPGRQASRLLFETVYKKHPYGLPVLGFENNIRTVKREKILEYYHKRYVPENMTLVVVGDFDKPDMKKLVKEYFGPFPEYKLKKIKRIKEEKQEKTKIAIKKASFQDTMAHIAFRSPSATHKDVPALDVLALILGQGESSRLLASLRNEKHLTNYTVASNFAPIDKGFFVISSSLLAEKYEAALDGILEEIEGLFENPPSEEEITKAVTILESERFYAMETVDGLAQTFGSYEHMFGDPEYFNKYLKSVSELTAQDLLKVAKKYLRPESMSVTVLTPSNEADLKKITQKWSKKYRKAHEEFKIKKTPATTTSKSKKLKWKLAGHPESVKFERIVLPSGSTLVFRQSKDVPVVAVRTAFLGGMRNQQDPVTNEMLSRAWVSGTDKLSEKEIYQAMESSGARLSAFSGRNTVGLSMTALKPQAREMMGLYEDVMENSTFPEEVVDREKMQLIESFKRRQDSPAQECIRQFMAAMFDGHPYGRDGLESEQAIEGVNSKATVDHLKRMLNSSNTSTVLVGDFEENWWVDKLTEINSHLPTGNKFDRSFEWQRPKDEVRIFKESQKEQTHIVVGYPGLTFSDDEKYALEVMQTVLSGQGGRLFIELRDKASLAYSVSPIRMDGLDAGYFGAYIGCSPDKGETAISMMMTEFDKLKNDPISEDELTKAKRNLIGRHDISLQKSGSVATAILFDEIYGEPYDDTFKFARYIGDVSKGQIQDLAQKILGQPAVISAVGSKQPW